jgi:hypothetical protein
MYINNNAIATAEKTKPVSGTKIEGKNEVDIVKIPAKSYWNSFWSLLQILPHF